MFDKRPSQAGSRPVIAGGSAVAGFSVGILCLDTRHPLLPGNVQNARSFPAPVIYETVAVSDPWRLMKGEPELLDAILAGARMLVSKGVGAVVGACGSFAYYQKPVAEALEVPVFLSILTQVPFLQQALGPRRKLLVVCASAGSMNARVYDQCGIDRPEGLVVREMVGRPEFDRLVRGEAFDPAGMEAEVLDVVRTAVAEDAAIGAVLFQCSDLPPFAGAVQAVTGLPVFDMRLLIEWLQGAFRPPFGGAA